jgi:tripartite-type tricarboxylate transporter receptor subunit TctC
VENKPDAAGNIAMQEVANSNDEHTMILGHLGTLAVNPYIFTLSASNASKQRPFGAFVVSSPQFSPHASETELGFLHGQVVARCGVAP